MTTGKLYKVGNTVYRVLEVQADRILLMNCLHAVMPKWHPASFLEEAQETGNESLPPFRREMDLNAEELAKAHMRYSTIAGILPFISEDKMRAVMINRMAAANGISRRTVCNYLCRYLIYEDIGVLADTKRKNKERSLTADEKNFRWALNKFYYTQRKNSLMEAYVQMLKERYCGPDGILLRKHSTIWQFRYFFNKTRKKQTEIISREGIKEYQLNHRPLLGDGVQEMAPAVGWGMLDGTICDIYLVDDAGSLVGRPVLLASVDAYSGLCMGYALLWEGGVYSVRELLLHTIADKMEWCRRFGIEISEGQWPCKGELPGIFICDRGSEYISYNFEQITELGCQLVSLSSFSANLKGPVEKLFDLKESAETIWFL